jgi:hypothetical protein
MTDLQAALLPLLDESGRWSPRWIDPTCVGALEAALPFAPSDVAVHMTAVIEVLNEAWAQLPDGSDVAREDALARMRENRGAIDAHSGPIAMWANEALGLPSPFRRARRLN